MQQTLKSEVKWCLELNNNFFYFASLFSTPEQQKSGQSTFFILKLAFACRHFDWEHWEQWEHRINSGLQRTQPVPSHSLDWEQFKPHKCAKVRRGALVWYLVHTFAHNRSAGKAHTTPA